MEERPDLVVPVLAYQPVIVARAALMLRLVDVPPSGRQAPAELLEFLVELERERQVGPVEVLVAVDDAARKSCYAPAEELRRLRLVRLVDGQVAV